MRTKKIEEILQKKGITITDKEVLDLIINTILESQQVKLSISSKIRVKTSNGDIGIIVLWKGMTKGEFPVYLEISENKYMYEPVFMKPEELTFVEFK